MPPITRPRSEQGFTLIELLVVILIIGVLTSVAVPMFMNQRQSAQDSTLASNMKSLAVEMATWEAKNRTRAEEMPITAGYNNWSIRLTSSTGAGFMGSTALANMAPAGFNLPPVNSGVAIGVLTNPATTGGAGYCMVGFADGSSHPGQPPEGTSIFRSALYYDSLIGGLKQSDQLSSTGACRYYHSQISQGH